MLKRIMSIILVAFMFIPMMSHANVKDYETQNLEEVLIEENIQYNLDEYKESKEKINIYLFRGNGCGVCKYFITFLHNNLEEYGKYFNLVSFEVFDNSKNSELLTEVSTFMGKTATGVPYIIIGDKVFPGFSEQSIDEIKSAIKELYESKDRYDVFEAMENNGTETDSMDSTTTIIMWNAIFMVIAVGIILLVNDRNTKKINTKINILEKKFIEKK